MEDLVAENHYLREQLAVLSAAANIQECKDRDHARRGAELAASLEDVDKLKLALSDEIIRRAEADAAFERALASLDAERRESASKDAQLALLRATLAARDADLDAARAAAESSRRAAARSHDKHAGLARRVRDMEALAEQARDARDAILLDMSAKLERSERAAAVAMREVETCMSVAATHTAASAALRESLDALTGEREAAVAQVTTGAAVHVRRGIFFQDEARGARVACVALPEATNPSPLTQVCAGNGAVARASAALRATPPAVAAAIEDLDLLRTRGLKLLVSEPEFERRCRAAFTFMPDLAHALFELDSELNSAQTLLIGALKRGWSPAVTAAAHGVLKELDELRRMFARYNAASDDQNVASRAYSADVAANVVAPTSHAASSGRSGPPSAAVVGASAAHAHTAAATAAGAGGAPATRTAANHAEAAAAARDTRRGGGASAASSSSSASSSAAPPPLATASRAAAPSASTSHEPPASADAAAQTSVADAKSAPRRVAGHTLEAAARAHEAAVKAATKASVVATGATSVAAAASCHAAAAELNAA